MDDKVKEELNDAVANFRNDIVEVMQKRKPTPYIAVYVLEIIKNEIINEVYKREFSPLPRPLGNNGSNMEKANN